MHPPKATEFNLEIVSDLHKWRVFVAIGELGSLTRASIFLDSNQSLLSRQINALERECGTRLFNRTGRGVELSEVGVRLFLKVKSLLVDAERLMDQIRAESLEPVGRVTLGLLPSIGPAVIGKLFNAIRKNNPGIKLKVLEGSGGQIEEWLADSRVDIAILYRYGAGFSTLEESLAIIDSYLVGPANDRITARPEIRFDELDKLPFILPSAPNGLRAVLDSTARHRRISLEPVIEADSLPLQKALVATEKLYTVLPLHAVWAEISQGTLRAAKIVDPPVRRTVAMVSVKSKGPSRAVSAVSSLIVQIVSAMAREGLWHSTSS